MYRLHFALVTFHQWPYVLFKAAKRCGLYSRQALWLFIWLQIEAVWALKE